LKEVSNSWFQDQLDHLRREHFSRWELAYLFGDNTVTMDDPDGQSTTIAGRAVTI